MLKDEVVVFLDDLGLPRNEQFLIEQGRGDLVISIRTGFQQVDRGFVSTRPSSATGRTVHASLSSTNLGPAFAGELFRLAEHSAPAEGS